MFSWKPDYSKLIISTKKNSLIIYTTDLKISSTVYIQNKIQEIFWHPDASSDCMVTSKYSNCFASICSSKYVVVFNIGQEATEKDDIIISKYESPLELINCISWSPYTVDHLAIATEQGIGVVSSYYLKKVFYSFKKIWLLM